MNIIVNGEPRTMDGQPTLQAYLENMQVAALDMGVAVVLNGEVARRADWPRIVLQPDDELEVVRATAGG